MNDGERRTHAHGRPSATGASTAGSRYVLIGALLGSVVPPRAPDDDAPCFYPLWGKQIEGWRGDVVDVLSVMLHALRRLHVAGLGVRQLNRASSPAPRHVHGRRLLRPRSEYARWRRPHAQEDTQCGKDRGECSEGQDGVGLQRQDAGWIVFSSRCPPRARWPLGLKRALPCSRTSRSPWACSWSRRCLHGRHDAASSTPCRRPSATTSGPPQDRLGVRRAGRGSTRTTTGRGSATAGGNGHRRRARGTPARARRG